MTQVSEEVATAAAQNWVVSIRTPGGFRPELKRIIVVQAFSQTHARQQAIKRVAVGKYKHVSNSMWRFDSVENADAPKDVHEQISGDGSGS